MDMWPLLNLGCVKVALSIKNKPPKEIRKIFNLYEKNKDNKN